MKNRIAILFTSMLSLLVSQTGAVELTLAAKTKLRAARDLSSTSLAAVSDLHGLIEVKQPGLPFGAVRGFDPLQVKATTAAVRQDLVEGLHSKELAGLRAYVDEFFPEAQLRTISVERLSGVKCSVSPCPKELAEPGSVALAYSQLHQFADKVVAATAYKISFQVRSTPPGARFTVQPLGGGFQTETATDSSIGELFRGLYRYKVERQGFKTVSATLNLVDNDPKSLTCELVPLESTAESLPCLFGIID